jgi:hypothetical protein
LGQVFERGRFGGHDLIRSFVVIVVSISRQYLEDVSFVLAYLLFFQQRLKCKAKSWCLDVEILKFPRLHGSHLMPEQEDIS